MTWRPGVFDLVRAAGLEKSDFDDKLHRDVYGAIQALHASGVDFDVVTVFERLRSVGAEATGETLRYLNSVCHAALSAASAPTHAALVKDAAARRSIHAAGQALQQAAAGPLRGAQLSARIAALAAELSRHGVQASAQPAIVFDHVPLSDLQAAETQPQEWWWDKYVPAGHVTLWSGHGGAGKSTLALMLLAMMASGQPFLGRPTRRGKLLFFSAEDPGQLVRLRLRRVCAQLGIDAGELARNLSVIDATELDAALYVEQRVGGVRHGATTPTYDALQHYIDAEGIDVVVLDNASDLFDGDEIVRTLVRGFIRSLSRLVRARGGAAVLLAHVDKGTSRAGRGASSESYSGSTGWHNSVRSRLVLLEKEPGLLELQHQKSNLGPRQAPVLLNWPEGGLPTLTLPDLPYGGPEAAPTALSAMRALVALIRDYYVRGEWVSTAVNSQSSGARLLCQEARYPRHLKPAQVAQLLREAQRARYLECEPYRGADRKQRERWRVTSTGVAMVDDLPLFLTEPDGRTT